MKRDLSDLKKEVEDILFDAVFSPILFDQVLEALGTRYRQILLMRYKQGLSLAEIAHHEDVSRQRIQQLITYSKRLIAEYIEDVDASVEEYQ